MQLRRSLIVGLLIVLTILVLNAFSFNRWIARHSVPAAAYTTILPLPFHISGKYHEGYFQGVALGAPIAQGMATLAKRVDCRVAIADGFVDVEDFRLSNADDSGLVMLCKSGGIAWNEIFVIDDGVVREIRISGGLWL